MNINIMNMSYYQACKIFNNPSDEIKLNFLKNFPINPVIDLRNKKAPSELLDLLIYRKSFIIIDGASGTGKSTFSQRIKEKYGDSVEIVDIDKLCIEWFREKEKTLSPRELVKLKFNFSAETVKYITENLE